MYTSAMMFYSFGVKKWAIFSFLPIFCLFSLSDRSGPKFFEKLDI
jgi:hypothetical protein